MKNIKLTLAYDGSGYMGWQKAEAGPSIEGELERVLVQILQHPVKLQAASRTDSGVHAEGQVVNFFIESTVDIAKLQKGCNALLPETIRVMGMEEVGEGFHPTLDAKGKEYIYDISVGEMQLPFERHYAWHFYKPVDVEKMREAAQFFVGKHDFSALTNEKQDDKRRAGRFCEFGLCKTKQNRFAGGAPFPSREGRREESMLQSRSQSKFTKPDGAPCNVREVYKIEIVEVGSNNIRIHVAGNRFLYKMVRNIVGTLVYVGCGMISMEDASKILQEGDRTKAGMTAPAHGLKLKSVFYD